MTIIDYLKMLVEKDGSDLFYRAGGTVRMRINGLVTQVGSEIITMDDIDMALQKILSKELRDFFKRNLDVEFAYYCPELKHRFRVSIFNQRNWPSIVVRNVPARIKTLEELNLPAEILKKLALERRGIVLLTGTMGSGKSTTIASMIEYINENCYRHIYTLEEPIEATFEDKNCIINQRELNKDVVSYSQALRSFTLQSPDVIYIGNIRDTETMAAALTVAETGVLVLSTLHTVNAPQTVERIINFFPPHQHQQICTQLSVLLKGVISLRLIPLKDKSGRVPACEIMLLSPTISRLIRENKIWEIPRYIAESEIFGMQTFEQALVKLVKEGKISEEDALSYCDNKDEFVLALKGIKKH
ncbi:MAG: PilT/PilU family type 4a pilus ATPase [Candidatus Omnitrophica bacterium]|nr:PilT/PilU family type 4a pilus ATPase [Candidatus Omnitrophota bacterium]